MICVGTICKVADNSGAILVKCIKVLKISSRIGAVAGQTITISVKKNVFKRHIIKKSKIIIKGQICKALILRTKKNIKR
jgi:large subunit ribosomal protein L14